MHVYSVFVHIYGDMLYVSLQVYIYVCESEISSIVVMTINFSSYIQQVMKNLPNHVPLEPPSAHR